MSKEDEDKDLEELKELEAQYRAELKKKIQFLKTENEAKEQNIADEEANVEADRLEAEKIEEKNEFLKEIGETYGLEAKGNDPIDPNAANLTRDKENKHMAFHSQYLKKIGVEDRVIYGSSGFIAGDNGFAFTDSDTGCEDNIDAWSPADTYCDLIWQAAQCGKQLSGIVTVRACDINAGDGLTVQVRAINADTFPASALNACECATCVSNVFTTYPLTLARYDIYKVVCHLDIFDTGPIIKSAMVEAMSRAFISGIDALIFTALSGATPGFSETAKVSLICDPEMDTSCCTYGQQLYKEIIELEAQMRAAGYGQNGFFLILHPRIATFLKYKEGGNYPPWVAEVQMEGNTLIKLGNIKVIEYCGATTCTNAGDAVVGILLDPDRAVGEAYGKRPSLLTDVDPIECDSTKLVMRTYVAIAAMDLNAIGHILNP